MPSLSSWTGIAQNHVWHSTELAALATPIPPETTAAVIRHILESGTWHLHHPSGPDAAVFVGWRAAMADEQWVDWNAQDDETWHERVQSDFGLDARPVIRPAGGAS